ncbi:hypothetical protein [Nitrosospira sp. Is2]|uniref:hypothetical protein n=1 Tax=Nitrosospira sp. Is2 TaxID=3080532 RepID=UPI0029554D60|nr:hypothetical protein [Nitrosospira sp. Is2]WON75317.1 hypothetical protein R5L00_07535 [Nitrosospira sp. Is2]
MDLGTAFLDDVVGVDAVEPKRVRYRREYAEERLVGTIKQHISTPQNMASVTEYVDVLLPNTLTYWISRAAAL